MKSNHRINLSMIDSEYSLHDCKIDHILIDNNAVQFQFSTGIIDCKLSQSSGELMRTDKVTVTFSPCLSSDFNCYIYRRFHLGRRVITAVEDITIEQLIKKLKKGMYIDIIDEFYAYQQVYWRGECYPSRTFCTELVITANGIENMDISWET